MGLLDGKVAVVTGAGGGIGRSHALALAKEGAAVVVNDVGGSRDGVGGSASMADQVVAEIKALHGKAAANYDSVATVEGGKKIVQTAIDNFGKIDILVNNAGILRDKTLVKMTEEQWDAVIAVHLKGTFACTQPAVQFMRDHNIPGRIINTSSLAGLIGNFGQANYGAAKAGIAGFTRVVALETQKHGITCNAIAPIAKTRMTEDLPMFQDAGETFEPELISPVVVFLASDLASNITGKIFGVHGKQLFGYQMKTTEGVTKAEGWTPQEIAKNLPKILGEEAAA
jgi:NAD(P)-dependent dehydrogenase (short-subunit alcohol dehydrogenase family)